MERLVGTVSRGIRAPIIREGDDIAKIVADSVLSAAKSDSFSIGDRDVIAVTEAVVARARGIMLLQNRLRRCKGQVPRWRSRRDLSHSQRNRFAICLKGIAMGAKKIVLMLSYPSDEVGNHLIDLDRLDEKGINPWSDVLTEEEYRDLFGFSKHVFTGVDYIEYYKDLIRSCGCEVQIVLANDCRTILRYTKNVLCCDIHTRARSKRLLQAAGAEKVLCLDEILNHPVEGSGWNEEYGLLGSNKATEEKIKLFPRDCAPIVERIQQLIFDATGKKVEVMVYGDGAFKDPVGKIWELADPVVSPAYTKGPGGTAQRSKTKISGG